MSYNELGLIQEEMQNFNKSDIEFLRSHSFVPSFPLATIGIRNYASFELEGDGVTQASFELEQLYLSAGLPILMDEKDAIAIDGYVSHNNFSSKDAKYSSFHVNSVGIPLAWLRQVNPSWQAAAFVMPMANKSSLDNSNWSWQTLGGVFGRYVQSETLWWAFGFYIDVGGSENTYLPYVGASWEINEHWSINAMLPWPSILYAPDDNWLFTLGSSP
ncbi:hypothetical protein FS373_07835 [Shewanella sp. YLB-07]|nr:hypothetical protein [Shewanella sp. YLB-07]